MTQRREASHVGVVGREGGGLNASGGMRGFSRGAWRLSRAFGKLGVRRCVRGLAQVRRYFSELQRFRSLGGVADFGELAPCLFDVDTESQSGGGHYFYQDVWALRHLALLRPSVHHDVGSRLDGFAAQATAICPIVYLDIRSPHFQLPDFEFRQGNIVNLPLGDGSVASISCLHVAEHIGLGRYGDPIDPLGTERALIELQRVLAPAGVLLFSMPVGRERVEFNAQRIWNPLRPIELLRQMDLVEFSAVDDDGEFRPFVEPQSFAHSKYACGLYRFVRQGTRMEQGV